MLGRELAPGEVCDHINRVRLDNRRENLRVTTHSGNCCNRTPRGSLGVLGVTFHKKTGKWQVQLERNGKNHYCGLFNSLEEARRVAEAKRSQLDCQGGKP
jgi:hypothetical protein